MVLDKKNRKSSIILNDCQTSLDEHDGARGDKLDHSGNELQHDSRKNQYFSKKKSLDLWFYFNFLVFYVLNSTW